jgi:hypothetical protein
MISATVIGHLGRDAELDTDGDYPTARFSIASSDWLGGERRTTWVRCKLVGQRAEKLAPMLVKGGRVAVAGTLAMVEGKRGLALCCDVRELELLGDRKPREQAPRPRSTAEASSTPRPWVADAAPAAAPAEREQTNFSDVHVDGEDYFGSSRESVGA